MAFSKNIIHTFMPTVTFDGSGAFWNFSTDPIQVFDNTWQVNIFVFWENLPSAFEVFLNVFNGGVGGIGLQVELPRNRVYQLTIPDQEEFKINRPPSIQIQQGLIRRPTTDPQPVFDIISFSTLNNSGDEIGISANNIQN